MTTTAKPAQRQHRLWAIVMLLPVLLACLCSCHHNSHTINDAAGQQALGGESVADTIHNASRGMTLASAKEQSGAADAHFDAAKIENRVRTSAQEMRRNGQNGCF